MAVAKTDWSASAALTITIAGLATSATLVAGVESTAIDNTANKYPDILLAGKITTGTSPTGNPGTIAIYVYGSYEDTPIYPDVLDGTNSAETFTSVAILQSALRLVAVISTSTTSNITYWFGPTSIALAFGGRMPKFWGVFVTHSTGVNLHATGGNHAIWYTPTWDTII